MLKPFRRISDRKSYRKLLKSELKKTEALVSDKCLLMSESAFMKLKRKEAFLKREIKRTKK